MAARPVPARPVPCPGVRGHHVPDRRVRARPAGRRARPAPTARIGAHPAPTARIGARRARMGTGHDPPSTVHGHGRVGLPIARAARLATMARRIGPGDRAATPASRRTDGHRPSTGAVHRTDRPNITDIGHPTRVAIGRPRTGHSAPTTGPSARPTGRSGPRGAARPIAVARPGTTALAPRADPAPGSATNAPHIPAAGRPRDPIGRSRQLRPCRLRTSSGRTRS